MLFSGHYGFKTDISPQSCDHWLQAHTRNQRNSASDSHNTERIWALLLKYDFRVLDLRFYGIRSVYVKYKY